MDRVDRLVEEVCERYRGIAADEDRYPRERERHGRKERSEERKKRNQRPRGEGRLVVAGVIDDRVGALDLAGLVEPDRRQLVMLQVAGVETAQEPNGLEVQKVAMENILAKTQYQAARDEGRHHRRRAGLQVLIPRRPEHMTNEREKRGELTRDEEREIKRRQPARGAVLERQKIQ